jgi:hypothetical protein
VATRPGSCAGLVEGHRRLGATFSAETIVDGAFGATDLSGSSSSRTSMSARLTVFDLSGRARLSRRRRQASFPSHGIRLREGSQAIAPSKRP